MLHRHLFSFSKDFRASQLRQGRSPNITTVSKYREKDLVFNFAILGAIRVRRVHLGFYIDKSEPKNSKTRAEANAGYFTEGKKCMRSNLLSHDVSGSL